MDNRRIKEIIKQSINIKEEIYGDSIMHKTIDEIINLIVDCYKYNGKVLLCGNGGSAADAQHIAAELSGRFYLDRSPLFAEALHVNSSYITSVANDYGYDEIYSRLVEGFGRKNDILIGLSTSGNSPNIIRAFTTAKKIGIKTIALTGKNGGKIKDFSDYIIKIPSSDTPRIQESHIMIGHIICEFVEEILFKK